MERDKKWGRLRGGPPRQAVWGSSVRGRHSFQLRVLRRRLNVRFGVVGRAGHGLFVSSRSWRRPSASARLSFRTRGGRHRSPKTAPDCFMPSSRSGTAIPVCQMLATPGAEAGLPLFATWCAGYNYPPARRTAWRSRDGCLGKARLPSEPGQARRCRCRCRCRCREQSGRRCGRGLSLDPPANSGSWFPA